MRNRNRNAVYGITIAVLVMSSYFAVWFATRVWIPSDVRSKLDNELIQEIEAGTADTIHDCIVLCKSIQSRDTAIDTLPDSSVEEVWDIISAFHAYLSVQEIYRLARMDEVSRIEFNSVFSIQSI